jgi:peptide/nickel transport system permease protein
VISAVKRYSIADHAVSTASLIGLALPNFWLALLLILTFSVHWKVLPSAGMYQIGRAPSVGDRIEHLILPTIVLAVGTLAQLVRYTRSSMLEVLGQDYVRTARAKGLSEATVLNRHALRNALIPVITVIGLQIPRFIGGSIIVETIFAWPGIGRLAYSAALTRDYPLIMGVTVIISIVVLISNLLTDLAYTLVNPRIRLQ